MNQKRVMISSTALDLPEHRIQVKEACLRMHMEPLVQEHAFTNDAGAVAASMNWVDKADIYVGIVAHRYGHVPKRDNRRRISITEMEYNRACERGIPRKIFLIHDKHPISISDVEIGLGAAKLTKWKARLKRDNVVETFESAQDLRVKVVENLAEFRQPDTTPFQSVSNIPRPPKRYVAHPYTLLQDRELVGRKEDLNWLNKWARATDLPPVMMYVGWGGMGKSALTWKWFNDDASKSMKPLAGRIWWSFYDSDSRYDNLIIRCLAYVSSLASEDVQQFSPRDREEKLLMALDHKPFLLVFDGLERTFPLFNKSGNRADVKESDFASEEENETAALARDPIPTDGPGINSKRSNCYKATDPRLGAFLRKLLKLRASKILITSRMPSADLVDDHPFGSGIRPLACKLEPLNDEDALELWKSFHLKVTDAADLLSVFHQFQNHSLFICSLAGEVRNYRYAPGDFTSWRRANPDFRPEKQSDVEQVKAHMIQHALRDLEPPAQQVILTVAGCFGSACFDMLVGIFVGSGKLFRTEQELDVALTDLEKRGLVGWDRRANRYDLHPVLSDNARAAFQPESLKKVYESLLMYFEKLPVTAEPSLQRIEDIAPTIELYNAMIGLGRFDDACDLIQERKLDETLHQLSAISLRIELLRRLFPDGVDKPPALNGIDRQVMALNDLGRTYVSSGQLSLGVDLLRRQVDVARQAGDHRLLRDGSHDLANALRLQGALHQSEAAAGEALAISRAENNRRMEGINLHWLGMTLAVRGREKEAGQCLQRTVELLRSVGKDRDAELMRNYLAQLALWSSRPIEAMEIAKEVHEVASASPSIPRHCIRSDRLQGQSALLLGQLDVADTRLHYALETAREIQFVEEEVPVLIALAELSLLRRELHKAGELLGEAKSIAVRSPYPLSYVDALNLEFRLREEMETEPSYETIRIAEKAYKLAWCDGPPFAYHWGLVEAEKGLRSVNTPIPPLPSFESRGLPPLQSWDRV